MQAHRTHTHALGVEEGVERGGEDGAWQRGQEEEKGVQGCEALEGPWVLIVIVIEPHL